MWLMGEKKAEAFLQFQASYKLYLPMGHIKSTMKNDEEFIKYFKISEKWLHMASYEEDESTMIESRDGLYCIEKKKG